MNQRKELIQYIFYENGPNPEKQIEGSPVQADDAALYQSELSKERIQIKKQILHLLGQIDNEKNIQAQKKKK